MAARLQALLQVKQRRAKLVTETCIRRLNDTCLQSQCTCFLHTMHAQPALGECDESVGEGRTRAGCVQFCMQGDGLGEHRRRMSIVTE